MILLGLRGGVGFEFDDILQLETCRSCLHPSWAKLIKKYFKEKKITFLVEFKSVVN